MTPSGAMPIIEARKRGFKPADMVIVSLVGRPGEANPTVYANPNATYDWRWLVDLQVCIYAKGSTCWEPTAKAIASCRPACLFLWDVERYEGANVHLHPYVDDIEKPQSQWRWRLNLLPWLPFQNEAFAWN